MTAMSEGFFPRTFQSQACVRNDTCTCQLAILFYFSKYKVEFTVCYVIVTKISLFLECVQAIKHIENLQKSLQAFSSLRPL